MSVLWNAKHTFEKRNKDFVVPLSLGEYAEAAPSSFTSYTDNVEEGAERIITQPGAYALDNLNQIPNIFPDEPKTLYASSTSADDNPLGPGAYLMFLLGLSEFYVPQAEYIFLSGQNPVQATYQYLRVNSYAIFGSNLLSPAYHNIGVGDISIGWGTVTAGVNANPMQVVLQGENAAYLAANTIPAYFVSMLLKINFLCSGRSNTLVKLYGRLPGVTGFFKTPPWILFGDVPYSFGIYPGFPPTTDVYLTAEREVPDVPVPGTNKIFMEAYIVDNKI